MATLESKDQSKDSQNFLRFSESAIKIVSKTSGSKIFIDPSLCIGCGICQQVCPFGLPEKKLYGTFIIEKEELCIECGACKKNCPVNAVNMTEQTGCGCLWNVKSNNKNGCCGDSGDNCCC